MVIMMIFQMGGRCDVLFDTYIHIYTYSILRKQIQSLTCETKV